MSSAGIHNLLCDQGATFRKTLTMFASDGTTAIDLTGFTARMKIKDEVGGTLIKSLTSSSGGGLTIGGSSGQATNGEIDILISASDTASFSAPLDAVYDLEIQSNTGIVDRVLQGKFIINPEVTD
jgi:hypothetical protein